MAGHSGRGERAPFPGGCVRGRGMLPVWRGGGETTVKDVMEALNRKAKPPRAYTTYMSVMHRLNDKRLLDRRRTGRQDTYVPRLSREEYQELRARAEVEGLVDEFGDVALPHAATAAATARDSGPLARTRRPVGLRCRVGVTMSDLVDWAKAS